MSRPPKKTYNQKVDFSDEDIYDQIKDQVQEIKESNLKKVEEEIQIYELYLARKQEKKKIKLMNSKNEKNIGVVKQRDSSDDQEGQIHEKGKIDFFPTDFNFEGVPSISNLGDHIRPLTLTRNKIVDLLNSRRFEELVKGCFVRYLIDSNPSSNNNSYIIAQIVGVTQGHRQYAVNNINTKVLLKLQQNSESVVTLSLQLISNQHPPGGLQIEKWLQTNRNKIPKEKELKEKLDEHNKLLVEQLSSIQIDFNIWRKAQRIAQEKQQPNEDINPLIDFVSEKLQNLQIRIEDEKIGRNVKNDLPQLQAQLVEVNKVHESLKRIKQQLVKVLEEQRLRNPRKQKLVNMSIIDERRNDSINEKTKTKGIMLCTYEGFLKLKQQTIESHLKYQFQLDQEDMAY